MEEHARNLESLEGMLREGQQLLDRRQSALAADMLLRLVRALPPHSPMYETACARLSLAYQQQGKTKKAISMLRQAIKQAPRNAVYRLNLAQLYREDHKEERAVLEARRALNLSPDLVEARELVAEVCLEQGRVEGTLQEATEILKRSPRNLRALDLMGTAFLYQGDIGHALKIVDQMVLLTPGDPAHHFKRAILLQQQGQIGGALGAFLRVLELSPESDLAQQAAEAVQMLDDYQLRQILLLASEDAMFRYRLSQDVEMATRQKGYVLSPAGMAALAQVEFQEVSLPGIESQYRLLN